MKIFEKVKFENGRRRIYFFGKRIFSYKRETQHQIKPSLLANKYLIGLRGIEIGGATYNQFYLNTLNIDFTDNQTVWNPETKKGSNGRNNVDIVAYGDDLPFKDETWDFVINSHVIEHFWDPIKALKEWYRVVKPGGYIFLIVPHKERTFDKNRERTTLKELIDRHNGIGVDPGVDPEVNAHHSVWITEDFLELCNYLNFNVVEYQDVDDKIGNGFTIVIQK